MATHSSVLAWRIPGTGEPGRLPSMGSQSQTRLKRLSSSSSSVYGKDLISFLQIIDFGERTLCFFFFYPVFCQYLFLLRVYRSMAL